jgi:autophagy-related protein 13
MHQYPRPPPETASPANSERTNPTRTNNPRDREVQNLRNESPHTQNSGSSEDFATARQEQPADNPGAEIQRLNQVIQNFHTKAALIILHSRVDLAPAYSKGKDEKRVNRWFNIELDETDDYKDDIRRWKTCDLKENRPPPLVIEILLNTDALNQSQRLVILDDDGRRYDVMNALTASQDGRQGKRRALTNNEVVLERWLIQLHDQNSGLPPDLAQILPLVYKKSIVLFRSLFTYCNFLPAWKLSRKIGKARSNTGLKLSFRILDGSQIGKNSQSDSLKIPLGDSSAEQLSDYQFGITDSPAGPFSVHVTYRNNCDFRVDDSEAILSSRFATSDDELFPPSLPRQEQTKKSQEIGSLPTDHRENLFKTPELGQAYGSLGTFHQAGIASGTSPISALRNAEDYTSRSPPLAYQARVPPSQHPDQNARPALAGTGVNRNGRRPSFSFQPFKAPVLSASPMGMSPLSSSPRTVSAARAPVLGSLTEEGHLPRAPTSGHKKSVSLAPEQLNPSSTSSSPKPAPVTRFSSSFGHRRARLSSGGTTTKIEEDQNSSGKISGTSSTQQPGSGLMAEAKSGGSSGSMQEDDENISDFLKMLDLKKDLLTPQDAAAAEASTKRTTAALNRFHRMRDSNAALSDSISSSQMLHRSSSSSSRQLSSVPPMVAATSVSTSSSPGKPISPHTPHTPFAPSRLSAAYSHDDTVHETHLAIPEEEDALPISGNTSDTTNVPAAIDIPNSPRPFLPGYRRSSSAQRRPPLPDDDDIGDLYGMRSASMGANAMPTTRATSNQSSETAAPQPEVSSSGADVTSNSNHAPAIAANVDGATSTGTQQHNVYRSRLSRGAGRGAMLTPPQGSTSSFGGTDRGAGSAEGSGASGSWGARGGSLKRRGSRTENKFGTEEEEGQDDFLPFAMERSELK